MSLQSEMKPRCDLKTCNNYVNYDNLPAGLTFEIAGSIVSELCYCSKDCAKADCKKELAEYYEE